MSNFIKCSSCGHEISITDAQYQSIAEQVRSVEFEQEVQRRLIEFNRIAQLEFDSKKAQCDLEYTNEIHSLEHAHQSKLQAMQNQVTALEYELKNQLVTSDNSHQEQLRALTSELEYYKNLKLNMSTKMIGESLENWCQTEFNKMRMAAFSMDYFEKDNKLSETGSKGDFIYRAYDMAGHEILSIMFEMKNEMSGTAVKHKNQDFLKELDKDRREKQCEYAVLCSLLESDNELYNQGIVDVSYQYEKMYVIRPQFFISFISLLRNMSMGQTMLRNQIAEYEQENLDLVAMQNAISEFQTGFSKNYDLAQRKFDETLLGIDKAISCLQKTKESLMSCERNMRLAGDKADKVCVAHLAKNAPSILDKILK